MALRLTVPAQAPAPDPSVETRPVYVEEWVEGLPYADPVGLVHTVHQALFKLNRCRVKTATRFTLLEHYVRPFQYCLDLQETQGAIHSIAVLERYRADTEAARRLAMEMAYGYKRVLLETPEGKTLIGGRRLLGAAQRAGLFLAFAVLSSYHEYLPVPKNIWSELAEIYHFGEESGHTEAPENPHAARPEFSASLPHIYKRILLTSLVDPYHLSYGDTWRVFLDLADLADLAEITEVRPVTRPAGIFVIDPKRGGQPVSFDPQKHQDLTSDCNLLDAGDGVRALQARIAAARQNEGDQSSAMEPAARVSLSRLAKVVRSLGVPPKRHSPRSPSQGQVNLATGLSTLHFFLGGRNETLAGEAAWATGQSLGGEGSIDISLLDEDEESDEAGPTYSAEYWGLVNKGPNGVGIIKHLRPNHAIGVGEVLGIQFPNKEHGGDGWSVGVVRWLSIAHGGEYQAGVQFLSRQVVAGSLRLIPSSGEAPPPKPVLMLGTPGQKDDLALITACGTYGRGRAMSVQANGQTLNLQADALIEATSSFELFKYQLVA